MLNCCFLIQNSSHGENQDSFILPIKSFLLSFDGPILGVFCSKSYQLLRANTIMITFHWEFY